MRAHPAILRAFVLEARQQGKSYRVISAETRLPLGTVKTITARAKHETRHETPVFSSHEPRHETRHETLGEWMQSLLHETAHFVVNGVPACSSSPTGAKIVPGMQWFKHDGCVRKCLRCMKHAENA